MLFALCLEFDGGWDVEALKRCWLVVAGSFRKALCFVAIVPALEWKRPAAEPARLRLL